MRSVVSALQPNLQKSRDYNCAVSVVVWQICYCILQTVCSQSKSVVVAVVSFCSRVTEIALVVQKSIVHMRVDNVSAISCCIILARGLRHHSGMHFFGKRACAKYYTCMC